MSLYNSIDQSSGITMTYSGTYLKLLDVFVSLLGQVKLVFDPLLQSLASKVAACIFQWPVKCFFTSEIWRVDWADIENGGENDSDLPWVSLEGMNNSESFFACLDRRS